MGGAEQDGRWAGADRPTRPTSVAPAWAVGPADGAAEAGELPRRRKDTTPFALPVGRPAPPPPPAPLPPAPPPPPPPPAGAGWGGPPRHYGAPAGGAPPYGQPRYGQPRYGAPGYGPPRYPPLGAPVGAVPPTGPQPSGGTAGPHRRRTTLLLAAGVLVLVVAVAAVVLALRGGTRVLDRSAAERDVAAQFQQQEGVAVRLTCADDMVLRDGARYRCRGATAAGQRVTVTLTITDARQARYTWSAS